MRSPAWIALLAVTAATPVAAQTPGACPTVTTEAVVRSQPGEMGRGGAVAAIRDSLRTELRDAARAAGVAEPRGLVFARMRAPRSADVRVWSYGSNVPDAVSQTVVSREARLLACWPEPEILVHVRLDSLPVPERGAVANMPVLLTAREFAADLARISSRRSSDPLNRARLVTVEVRMLVTRDGEVAHAELVRGTTRGDVDRAVLEAARRMRFRPADVESGEKVDVWVQQPVEVQIQG